MECSMALSKRTLRFAGQNGCRLESFAGRLEDARSPEFARVKEEGERLQQVFKNMRGHVCQIRRRQESFRCLAENVRKVLQNRREAPERIRSRQITPLSFSLRCR